jgi:hypothetical protein
VRDPWHLLTHNAFWLLLPILGFNLALAGRLPKPYQPPRWDRIPRALALPENFLRAVVFVVPLLLVVREQGQGTTAGWGLYGTGVGAYALSWVAQLWRPDSRWSRSDAGHLAPALTPMLWLSGLALLAEPGVPGMAYETWMGVTAAAAFVTVHGLHAWSVRPGQADGPPPPC